MNKKILFGCLGAFLLLLVGGAVGLYVFVWKPMSSAASGAMQSVKESVDAAKQVQGSNQLITNQTPFIEPANGELNDAQIAQLIAANDSMALAMGDKLKALEAKYKAIEATTANAQPSLSDLGSSLGALGEIAGLTTNVSQARVAALNAQNLSLEEYRWISATAFAALTAGAASEATKGSQVTLDALKQASEQMAQQATVSDPTATDPNAPAVTAPATEVGALNAATLNNYERVKPHREAILKGQVFGFLPF